MNLITLHDHVLVQRSTAIMRLGLKNEKWSFPPQWDLNRGPLGHIIYEQPAAVSTFYSMGVTSKKN